MGKIYSVDSSDMVSSLRVATLYLPECRSVMIALIPISIDVTIMGMCVVCVDCSAVCGTVVMVCVTPLCIRSIDCILSWIIVRVNLLSHVVWL